MPRGEKSFVPELKGLVTKACDILRLQNPCVVNPQSVTRECSDFTREMRLVSRHGVSVAFQPGGHPGEAKGLGGWSNQQFGGAFLGSELKSPLSQACNFRDTINTHTGNPQIYSREGNLILSWWRLWVMEIWVLILMKSHLWSQTSDAWDILATETQKQFPEDVFFRFLHSTL